MISRAELVLKSFALVFDADAAVPLDHTFLRFKNINNVELTNSGQLLRCMHMSNAKGGGQLQTRSCLSPVLQDTPAKRAAPASPGRLINAALHNK